MVGLGPPSIFLLNLSLKAIWSVGVGRGFRNSAPNSILNLHKLLSSWKAWYLHQKGEKYLKDWCHGEGPTLWKCIPGRPKDWLRHRWREMWHKSSYLRSLTVIGWCLGLPDCFHPCIMTLLGLRSFLVYAPHQMKGDDLDRGPAVTDDSVCLQLPAIHKGRLCNLVSSNIKQIL